ncbi:MAG: hypothetical protein ACE5E5_01460, partial [Phycisphaerae bacterium]
CDPATGCVNTNNAAPCDDANACTTGDTCSLGICVGGAPPNCNDGNVCTDDSCDPATGCVNTNNAAPCDDGLFCTSADVCVGGVCTGGGATNCSDADACTVDTCDEVADVCVNTAAGQVDVTVQAEALGFPVTRTVVCELSDCFGFVDVRAEPVVFDATGAGFVSLLGVPSNVSFIRVSEGHTLARTLPVSFAAACTVPVDLSGANQLLAGDFSNAFVPQDNLVDINDFSILAIAWNQTIDPNADFGADATGDGIQDVADFSAISANFAKVGDLPTNCVITASSAGDPGFPVASEFAQVSIDAAAFPQGQYADLNGDGVIDGQDMRLFVDRYGIPKTAPVRGLLRQLGVSEPGLPRAGAPSSIGRGRR